MTSLEKLNLRLQQLSEQDRERMAEILLHEMDAQKWDRQIENDLDSGKLDDAIERARRDHRSGQTRPVSE